MLSNKILQTHGYRRTHKKAGEESSEELEKINIFNVHKNPSTGQINVGNFLTAMERTGFCRTDPRLSNLMTSLKTLHAQVGEEGTLPENINLDFKTFSKLIDENLVIITQVLNKKLVIPEFPEFTSLLKEMFDSCKKNNHGQVASYIPQLARYSPDEWALSICTVDGQRFSIGDTNTNFTLQSCSKPFTYAICLNELGPDVVHRFVSHEPSGRNFNEICLDSSLKPHNPMLNSGAIMTIALALELLEPKMKIAEKFDYLLNYIKRIAGGEYVGFNNSVFLSERESADRNFAMAYYMRENKCFPPNTDLHRVMDLYFQSCSMEVTADTLSVMGSTLANGGICPITGVKVLTADCVRNVLSLMFSCGMYNYSGEFAFKVGLPAKSGVSGALIVVIPNVMGIGMWSPPLDDKGNTVRGLQFSEELVDKFNFHRFDNLRHSEKKLDPRRSTYEKKGLSVVSVLFAAKSGDVTALQRMFMQGIDLNDSDYDGRTALHVCSAEGHIDCVKFLIEIAQVNMKPLDRWGFTPVQEAARFNHEDVYNYLNPLCEPS